MKTKKYLYDIQAATEAVAEFLKGVDSFEAYLADEKTQSAVERKLITIGEAINKLSKLEDAPEISSTPDIIAFRNILVHAYDQISNRMVWAILQQELPVLKTEVNEILKTD